MVFRVFVLTAVAAAALFAEVVGFDLAERSAVLEGARFGAAGAYERVIGRARFAVDPNGPANRTITDIGLAPRNAGGLVEFSADVYILKPTQPERGSGTVLFEVSNRGGKGMLGLFSQADSSNDPRSRDEFGDGLLLERGYTLVWVGWQFDLLEREHALRLDAPVAQGVSGWTRSYFSPNEPAKQFSVAGDRHTAYPAADPNDPASKLIVRDHPDGTGREIARDRWRFSDPETVELDGGFVVGKTYDVVYRSTDPGVAGLGAAAIRDFISFLKFGGERDLAEASDLAGQAEHAIAFGSSQSGRFLRTFVYDGFNADEQGRQVFDGLWPHIAGAARGSFTHRFAQPTRQDPFFTVEVFPFRDLDDKDPATGMKDGILARATKAGVTPKIVYTLTSSEYWNRSASLLHTALDGKADAPLPETTRIYYFAGTQHGSGSVPPGESATLTNRLNANDYRPLARAVLIALDEWVTQNKQPPASRYPSIDELAALDKVRFPAVPGMRTPGHQRRAIPLDFGPEFLSKGIIALQPPKTLGPAYPAMLPQLDADGLELGGIRLPTLAVPLATYGGWNLFKPKVSDADHSPGNSGSTLPFAWTKAAREANGDPRPSVEERYASRAQYRERSEAAARKLVGEGFLLERDVRPVVERNLALWDWLENAAGATDR